MDKKVARQNKGYEGDDGLDRRLGGDNLATLEALQDKQQGWQTQTRQCGTEFCLRIRGEHMGCFIALLYVSNKGGYEVGTSRIMSQNSSFKEAHTDLMSSNVSNLISCVVLFQRSAMSQLSHL